MLTKNKLYTISLVEGASVMAAEICGAKLLAPFFGSSLYVWSSVMAITLGGLASGYFMGGQLSKKLNKEKTLLYILLVAVACLCLMPFLTSLFLITASHLPLVPAVIISVFFLLFPTMVCMGSTSPLIISILTHEGNNAGENSGKIYAVSTVGGIIATFLCGFYLIPTVGIRLTLIYFAIALTLACLLLLTIKKSKITITVLICLISLTLFGFANSKLNRFSIYKTEGILGTLEVRDEPSFTNDTVIIRRLLINTIIQTEMELNTKHSTSEYILLIKRNLTFFPKGKMLLLGLGGGVVANMLSANNYSVTAVEFDQRIIEMAKQFFYLDNNVKTFCDDARHFINQSNDKYKLVLFDVFKAEEQPSHVITKQSLIKLKTLLDSNGVILINTHGYLKGKNGLGTQSMLSTLKDAGFSIKICTVSENEDYRNLLIVASLKPLNFLLNNEIFPVIKTNPSFINTDDKPIMELLNAPANQAWRSNYLKRYILKNY